MSPSKIENFEQRLRDLKEAVDAASQQAGAPTRTAPPASNGDIDRTAVAFNVFTSLMDTDGIRSALYAVLRQSDYRFIGIFRFQGGKATSVVHVDRQDLSVLQASEVDDTATYCSFVRDGQRPFVTSNASTDVRTASHVARDTVLSYCGVPIVTAGGELIGTLCHYDLTPRDPAQLDLALLAQVSQALAESGRVPDYPAADVRPG